MTEGKKNNIIGRNAEKEIAQIFRKAGYTDCDTTLKSAGFDNAGIDLIGLPFNAQVKAGYQKSMNISKTLCDISNRIKSMFGRKYLKDLPVVLIHHKPVEGRDRNDFDDIVSMSLKDFIKIIKNHS